MCLGLRKVAQVGLLQADPLQGAQPASAAGNSHVIHERANRIDGQGDRVVQVVQREPALSEAPP